MTKSIVNTKNWSAFLVGLSAALTLFTGCSKGDNKNATDRNNSFYTDGNRGGSGYGSYGPAISSAIGYESNGRAELYLEFSSSTGASYGQTFAQGELNVTQPIACLGGYGGIETGRYQVVPYQNTAANMESGMVTGLRLVALGRSEVVIDIPWVILNRGSVCGYDGLVGSMSFVQVNGYACQAYSGLVDNIGFNGCR
jgi:hypothetical protein